MYIFRRTGSVNRLRAPEAIAAGIEVAGLAGSITGRQVSLHVQRFGGALTGVMWSTRLESFADYVAMTESLMASEEYATWLQDHEELFDGDGEDGLLEVAGVSGMEAGPRRFHMILSAMASSGKLPEVVAFGVRAQQFVADETGLATAFGVQRFGPIGLVSWLTGADTGAELDALAELQRSSGGYHALQAEAATMLMEGSGTMQLIERISS